MKKLLAIGETMACFLPDTAGPLRYVEQYHICTAGAESNVAVDAAKLGVESEWFSRLGDDEFGALVRNRIRAEGVDCSRVVMDPQNPTGLMFKQTGTSESKVYYTRKGSAASILSPADITLDLLQDVGLLHLTGITPVLSESCCAAVQKAFLIAKEQKIPVSFDPNIRRKLWHDMDYTALLRELSLSCTVLLLGLDEAEALFQTRDIKLLCKTVFAGGVVKAVAVKDGANGSVVAGIGGQTLKVEPWPCRCIEPIGAGDAYNAGFLAGWLAKKPLAVCARMGNIAGAMATETKGDTEGAPTKEQMENALLQKAEIYR